MLYWCFSQTSLRTHWKTCFTGVLVKLHSEHTEKCFTGVLSRNFTQNTLKKHALLVFVESNFTQNYWKNMLYWCLSQTSLRTHWKTCFTGVCWVELHSEHTEKHALLVFLSRTSLRTLKKHALLVFWVELHSEHTEKHALLVFVESNFTQNTLKNMLYWCCSQTSLRTHWKTCFTGVCWVKLHSEHTEKHALLVFVESNFTQNTEKHALLVFVESNFTQNTLKNMLYWCFRVKLHSEHTEKHALLVFVESKLHSEHTEKTCFTGVCWVELHSEHTEKHALLVFVESNFTQNTLKNMLYWCLLSRTSLRTTEKTCFTGVWVELHSEHTEKHALLVFVESNFTQNTLKNMLYWCFSQTSLRTHWKTCFTGVCWVKLHSEHTEKHALLVFVESNFTQNTLKNMLYWCLLSRTSLRTHWKTCFTGVCWVKLHSELLKNMLYWCFSQTSLRTHWKTCFTGVCWVELHSEHTEKHALLVFVESNFTQNTLKNMLYWCLLSRTSLRTHWKTCFTGVCWVELHSEHTEKHALLVFVESNFTQNTLKNMLYWCLLSRTSLRTHWKTCFTGVCWVKLHSEHTEKHALLVF